MYKHFTIVTKIFNLNNIKLKTFYGNLEGEENMLLQDFDRIHFIGIGGAGMSGIAKILLEMGYKVTGSDLKDSTTVERLKKLGAKIEIGHKPSNVYGAELVVVSSAIPDDNPELVTAREMGIKTLHRADILGLLMQGKKSIAVTGAHGKTTTTSMISLILEKNNLDPTILIGGELNDIGGNAVLGKGDFLVTEADESDGSFLKLNPVIGVVTNIENDHLDYYGNMNNLLQAFETFVKKLPDKGFVVMGVDNFNVRKIVNKVPNKRIVSFGIKQEAHYKASNIEFSGLTSSFNLMHKGRELGKIQLKVPGLHNVYNALAACAVGMEIGLSIEEINYGLNNFLGVKRRFQIIGNFDDIKIIDDYGHHPTEIKATLKAAKNCNPNRIVAIFQPHRYTRTLNLYQEFGSAFKDADVIILTDVYSAGEKPIPGVNSSLIKESIEKRDDKEVVLIQNKDHIVNYLTKILKQGDYVLTIGAGDIWKVSRELTNILNKMTA